MPTLTTWAGTTVQLADNNTLSFALDGAEPFWSEVSVVFGEDWRLGETEVLDGELTLHWRCGDVRAVVRHVFDQAWTLRVQFVNEGEQEATVQPCRLDFHGSWPVRRWLAGAEGQLSLDPGRADGALLTLTQLRGRSRLSDGLCWLADLPLRLGPAGTPSANYLVSWRADWLTDERMQAAALPGWWPVDVVLDHDEVVLLDLPDAAIEGAGMQVLEDEAGTTLGGQPGIHLAQVHSGHGTTDVELGFAVPLADEVRLRAGQILHDGDPRTCSPEQAFLVSRAATLGGVSQNGADFVRAATEEVMARPGTVGPFAVALLAGLALEDSSVAGELPELLSRLVEGPGAGLARVQAALALQLAGEPVHIPSGVAADRPGLVGREIHRLEEQLIRGEQVDPVLLRRVAGLLGAGLPGVTASAQLRAWAHAVTGLAVEHPSRQLVDDRWPRTLPEVRELALKRLLAEQVSDEVLAWSLW